MNTELSISELEGQCGSELPAREEFALVQLGSILVSAGVATVVVPAGTTVLVPVPLPTLPTLPTLPIPGLPGLPGLPI
jgi:hypothetical protein